MARIQSVSGGGGGDLNSGLPDPRVHGIATVLCFLSMTTKMTQGSLSRQRKAPRNSPRSWLRIGIRGCPSRALQS